MFYAIALMLALLGVFGLIAVRHRRTSERCRRYLATLEMWQPRVFQTSVLIIAKTIGGRE